MSLIRSRLYGVGSNFVTIKSVTYYVIGNKMHRNIEIKENLVELE